MRRGQLSLMGQFSIPLFRYDPLEFPLSYPQQQYLHYNRHREGALHQILGSTQACIGGGDP